MTQIYNIISIVAYSLAGVFFLVSVFLWFKFGIWEIIGDLSGRNAKKSIKQMRKENESSGVNLYRPSGSYGTSGEISVRQNSTKTDTGGMDTGGMKTGSIKTGGITTESMKVTRTAPIDEGSNATTLLDSGATELLDDGATELLDSGATELLDDGATELLDEGTTVLSDTVVENKNTVVTPKWTILQSIVLIHTDEEIA